jgi:hypothetical protein
VSLFADHEVPFSWLAIAAKLDHHPVAGACGLQVTQGPTIEFDAVEGRPLWKLPQAYREARSSI